MRKSSTSRFWKVYRAVAGVAVVLIAIFFIFFYDFIGSYEKSQPIYIAKEYAESLTDGGFRAMVESDAELTATVFESPEKAADAYCRAIMSIPGDVDVYPDLTSSTLDVWKYTVAKGDVPIASVSVVGDGDGKYNFQTWRVDSCDLITDSIPVSAIDYDILVPVDSTVTVNGHTLDGQYLLDVDTEYELASPLEKHLDTLCDTYRIQGLLSVPDVQCVWNGTACVGELTDGKWIFDYPASVRKTISIRAPAGAVVSVNGYVLGTDFITKDSRPYKYSVYDPTNVDLPLETEYHVSGLLQEPDISVVMNGLALSGIAEGTSRHFPYPEELLFEQIIYVPQGSTVRVNGQIVEEKYKEGCVPAYPDLFGDAHAGAMMDRYVLSGLYALNDNVQATVNGHELRLQPAEEGRGSTYQFLYPAPDNQEVNALILAFCKDYFAYTAGGYRNTEENLNRVLSYMEPNSPLYRRLLRSKESVGFVTPVSSQKFHVLSVDTAEELSDTLIVCSVSYEIEQWTYQVQRNYSGKLRLAFEYVGDKWVLSHMLTDIK